MTNLDYLKKEIGKEEPTLSDVLQRCYSFTNKDFFIGNRVYADRFTITCYRDHAEWNLSKNLLSEQSEETIRILAMQFSV